jgi:hypothetical protein
MIPAVIPTRPRQKPSQTKPKGTAEAPSAAIERIAAQASARNLPIRSLSRTEIAAPTAKQVMLVAPTYPASSAVSSPDEMSAGTMAV